MRVLKVTYPDIKWHEHPMRNQDGTVQIAPNIFLFTSNEAHALKAEADKNQPFDGTPALMRNLVDILYVKGYMGHEIQVVSQ